MSGWAGIETASKGSQTYDTNEDLLLDKAPPIVCLAENHYRRGGYLAMETHDSLL